MKPESDHSHKAEEIRSNIDNTRQRMDETIDALASRMKGRHLVDEVIGYFRTENGSEKAAQIKSKVTETAGTAMNTVLNSVKSNPWPAVLIGAGVAWLVYENRRSKSEVTDEDLYGTYDGDYESAYEVSGGGYSDIGDVEYGSDIAGQQSAGLAQEGTASAGGLGEKVQGAKDALRDKATHASEQLRDRASQIGQRVRDTAQSVRARAGELGTRVGERSREVYARSRERVVTTANQHPIEVGLGCLALGLIAGFALPTPQKVNDVVGPRADRLRDRARQASRDLVERGKHVVKAAADAARTEAEAQGLTADALRAKATAVADRAKEAATDTARNEGVMPTGAV
jgi:hypothetical protein